MSAAYQKRFIAAAADGKMARVESLLETGQVDINGSYVFEFKGGGRYDGCPALLLACMNNDVELVNFLLDQRADWKRLRKRTVSEAQIGCFHYAVQSYDPALSGEKQALDVLLERVPAIDLRSGIGRTALMYAVTKSWPAGKKLIEFGSDVNAMDHNRNTALHLAVEENKVDIILDLAAAGAKLNMADARGMTPLMVAAHQGHFEAVGTLLELGADPLIKDFEGKTASDIAQSFGYNNLVDLLGNKMPAQGVNGAGLVGVNAAAQIAQQVAEMDQGWKISDTDRIVWQQECPGLSLSITKEFNLAARTVMVEMRNTSTDQKQQIEKQFSDIDVVEEVAMAVKRYRLLKAHSEVGDLVGSASKNDLSPKLLGGGEV